MAKAKNKVIAGDYEKRNVSLKSGSIFIHTGFVENMKLTKEVVEAYEVITFEDIILYIS